MVIGIQADKLFTTSVFNDWNELAEQVKSVPGVEDVITLGKSISFTKDTSNKKMVMMPLFPEHLSSQHELDSLKDKFLSLPFYQGRLYNRRPVLH
jgi:predicted RND superfamily exporter protein